MRRVSFFVLLLLTACSSADQSTTLILESLPEGKTAYQKRVVGDLSGAHELADGSRLNSRWSADERRLAKNYLGELIRQLGIEPQEHHYKSKNLNPAIDLLLDPFTGTNVYAVLASTVPSNEYVVLGAHYDAGKRNAPGAIDNATGVTLIYSVFKEAGKRSVRNKNLVVVFFDQEEEELIGSKAFAKFLIDKNWKIHSVHCFDMVGWDGNADGVMGVYSASDSLLTLYREVAREHDIIIHERRINPEGYHASSTDFDAFVAAGFNSIGGGDDYYNGDFSPHKDSPRDTFETVNFEFLLSCTKVVEAVIKRIME